MPELTLIVTDKQEEDYDGAMEDVREICAKIDGETLPEIWMCDPTGDLNTQKTDFKALLTENGHEWDTEA